MRTRDLLPFVPARQATRIAFAALDGVQVEPPQEIVCGISLLFTQICKSLNLDPSQMINAAERRLKDDDTYFQREVKALDDYCKGQLLK